MPRSLMPVPTPLSHADQATPPAPTAPSTRSPAVVAPVLLLAALLLAGCASRPPAVDGPAASTPADLAHTPDAVPQVEPLRLGGPNKPYEVFGVRYQPMTDDRPLRERGLASWYGRKFHGQRTSIGEVYDMYAMTAAHPTLPLPSYARVTNVATGATVVVRVNDRGPFLHGRIIDLSYAAAHRLGIAARGSGVVLVESVLPGDATFASARPSAAAPSVTAPPVVAAPVPSAAGAGASAQSPVQASAGGFVVQLGAFGSEPNARAFLAHVQERLAGDGVVPQVRQSGGLFRVYVGPYASRDEAHASAGRIEAAFGMATSIAPH